MPKKTLAEYEEESKKINGCVRWLADFLTEAKPRRIVKGEAIKRGYTQAQLKAARKILHVKLLPQNAELPEDYWYFPPFA